MLAYTLHTKGGLNYFQLRNMCKNCEINLYMYKIMRCYFFSWHIIVVIHHPCRVIRYVYSGSIYWLTGRLRVLRVSEMSLPRWRTSRLLYHPLLTHWGRVTHICVNKLTIIGSDNGLPPGRRQAIIWTNAGLLLIGPLGTNFSEILIEI